MEVEAAIESLGFGFYQVSKYKLIKAHIHPQMNYFSQMKVIFQHEIYWQVDRPNLV